MKLIGAIQRAFGLTVRRVQMEVHGKKVDIDLRRKKDDPSDRIYRGGKP
jgi:hypothetical protein